MTTTPAIAELERRIAALEDVCAEAYQFAGTIGAPVRVLDRLDAAANGEPIPDGSMLPITAEECEAVAELRAMLDRVRAAVSEPVVTP
jgi:hypothetical protein